MLGYYHRIRLNTEGQLCVGNFEVFVLALAAFRNWLLRLLATKLAVLANKHAKR